MRMLVLLVCLVSAPAVALDLEEVIGEWSVDADSCNDMRLTFTIDFIHESIVIEEGRRQTLAVSEFSIDGDTLVIHAEDPLGARTAQRLKAVVVERDRLVLRSENEALAGKIGTDTLQLYRCPAY